MILRIAVVIPVWDNPRTISRVAREIVLESPYPVLILDDSSENPVTHSLYSFEVREAMASGRVRVIRFEKRQGRGGALRYAIKDLAAAGFTHMLTLEADGRFDPADIPKLVSVAGEHPWDLILGRRDLTSLKKKSRWAQLVERAVEYCVRFETGQRLGDPRSGFRIYPLMPLQMTRFRTRKVEFELEILIRALWDGVIVREVDVRTRAVDPADVTAPKKRGVESLRLSFLNTILITVTLLRTRSSPVQLALAMGTGVFVGCTPLLGIHAGMAVVFAAVFRLNVVGVLVGSRISTAPLLPFLILGSVYIGQNWLHLPEATGRITSLYQWAGGAVVLGVLLGIPAGVLTYVFARAAQNPRPVDEPTPAGARVVRWLAQRGEPAVRAWTAAAAAYHLIISSRARRGLAEFYRITAPKLGGWARLVSMYRHLREAMDLEADQILTGRRGRVEGSLGDAVVTAHLGGWANAARAAGLESTMPVDYPDRPRGEGRIEIIPFLGHLAAFDVSAFARAAREGQRLATAFATRENGEYVIHARDPRRLTLRTDQSEDLQIYEWASRFVVQLEFMIRKHPRQWTRLYRFWSRIPHAARNNQDRGRPIEELELAPPRLRPQRDH